MAPLTLPGQFGDTDWTANENNHTQVTDGIYPGTIFDCELKENKDGPFYDLKVRIDGGPFDGVDVRDAFVGLVQKTIFRIYDIATALGTIDQYYQKNPDGKGGRWVALPSKEELVGQRVFIRVEEEMFWSKKKGGEPNYEQDGSPRMLSSNRITGYFSAKEAMPTFTPTNVKQRSIDKIMGEHQASGGQVGQGGFTSGTAFPGQVTGFPPAQQSFPQQAAQTAFAPAPAAPAPQPGQQQAPAQGGFGGSVQQAGQNPW